MGNDDAEAHWGLVLSRYGVEYVEDPKTHERIPTLHRLQNVPMLSDADYRAALANAPDSYSRDLYEKEAQRISEIQKAVLEISAKEDPYDVFICYKDTAEGGSRTKDSTLAQDIYYQLVKAGYKVFFSRISLEDKLGREYEPYIFAALESSRVMLAIGTKPEYYGAVWVRNEWSRFLDLTKKDTSKLLIPCFRDMDPYDLPEEMALLQSLDMEKIGFMQDLLHGVDKVLKATPAASFGAAAPDASTVSTAPGIDALYKRGMLFLEDGDFGQASEYFDRVLDSDPEYAPAYAGKLMAACQVRSEEDLAGIPFEFSSSGQYLAASGDYQKAHRFGDAGLKARLEGYEQAIEKRVMQELEVQERIEEWMKTQLLSELNSNNKSIEWQVIKLEDKGKRALVITKCCIATMRYHDRNKPVTWEGCILREWLNEGFYKKLPTPIKRRVLSITLPYPDKGSQINDTNTTDRVFLLSVNEAKRYFPDDSSRATKYEGQPTWWWLRSPGKSGTYAAGVGDGGYISGSGGDVRSVDGGVRPAMWLSMESVDM